MNSILRSCVLFQRSVCLQTYASKKHAVTSFADNLHIKNFARCLQARYAHTADNNKNNEKLVYTGGLKRRLNGIKIFSLATSIGTIMYQPYLITHLPEASSSGFMLGALVIITLYSGLSPLLIHFVMGKKYVNHIYYNAETDKYIAELSTMFLTKRKIEFTVDDITVPDVTGPLTSCLIKGKPVFFSDEGFTDEVEYHKLMGHFKPLEYELNAAAERLKNVPSDSPEKDK